MARKTDIRQLNNPNNDAYWVARGWFSRPDDWRERVEAGDVFPESQRSDSKVIDLREYLNRRTGRYAP